MPRQNNQALPDNQELKAILDYEAKRLPPAQNRPITYPDFSVFNNLLNSFSIDAALEETGSNIYEVVANGQLLIEQLVVAITTTEPTAKQIEALHSAYRYLSEEDHLARADCIFVFGAPSLFRAQKALELFTDGYAKKIVIAGGGPHYLEKPRSEAAIFKQFLVENGVDVEQVLIEEESITMPDNVWRGLDLMTANNLSPNSMILVNSPYSQRRGWALFAKYTIDTDLIRVNSSTSDRFYIDNFYKQPETIKVVLNEFIKMYASVVYGVS